MYKDNTRVEQLVPGLCGVEFDVYHCGPRLLRLNLPQDGGKRSAPLRNRPGMVAPGDAIVGRALPDNPIERRGTGKAAFERCGWFNPQPKQPDAAPYLPTAEFDFEPCCTKLRYSYTFWRR